MLTVHPRFAPADLWACQSRRRTQRSAWSHSTSRPERRTITVSLSACNAVFRRALTFNVNYTWSHALDEVSNGGIANEPFGLLDTDSNITTLQNPNSVRGNYGNADYDVRHYFSASFVLTDMFRHARFHWGPNRIFGGWTLSSNWFFRSGLPFTVIDNSALAPLLRIELRIERRDLRLAGDESPRRLHQRGEFALPLRFAVRCPQPTELRPASAPWGATRFTARISSMPTSRL